MTIAPAAPPASAEAPSVGTAAAGTASVGTDLLRILTELTADLPDADPGRVAAAVLRGRSAGADEAELRMLAIESAAGLISEDPQYSRLAARLLTRAIADEAAGQGVTSFTTSIAVGHREGLIADGTAEFVHAHAARLNALIDPTADDLFGYFGLRTLHSRYLLRHPITRQVIETPQHFLLRVASGLAEDHSARAADEVAALYALMSRLDYLPSSPTLFNSGTRHPQMSSCYLLDSPSTSWTPSTTATTRSPACPSTPHGHRPVVQPHPLPRLPHPGHQRPLQRHRPVPEDPGRLGRRREPGRPAQGRRRGLPGDLALRHRGVPGAARQHR